MSDWSKYSDLLQQLGYIRESLDWSSWANLTASILRTDPGLWGAIPENAFFGKGLAELLGEIYGVQPGDVDLDDAAQLKTTDADVLIKLWHFVNARPATDLAGFEAWAGYFVCWESDGSLTYAAALDADDWEPVSPAEDSAYAPEPTFTRWGQYWIKDEGGERWYGASNPAGPWYRTPGEFEATLWQPAFTRWGQYWIKDEGGERWYGASNPDGPWYRTPGEFEATLWQPAPGEASAPAAAAADQVDAMLETLFTGDFFDELRRRLQKADLPPEAITDLKPEDFASIIAEAFAPSA